MYDVLTKILATKRDEVAAAMLHCSPSEQYATARAQSPVRGFAAALLSKSSGAEAAVIAEIKKASPSKGLLCEKFVPSDIAEQYRAGGAACLSVLTDATYFMGCSADLDQARSAVDLPVLRKDFIIDPYQIVQSRAMGADCVLLIVAALAPAQMYDLAAAARDLNMDVLVEVHDEDELGHALDIEDALIGVNNRDLRTFHTDIAVSTHLIARVPKGRMVVSESGISTRAEIAILRQAGVGAFLIGETLMRAPDARTALRQLISP